MRRLVLYGLMFALAPTLASAQVAPATPVSGATTPDANRSQVFGLMQQSHQQLRQLHLQTRAQMLASLTPAHRSLLGNIVGELAIAPNPNPQAAAQQLNAVLSTGEKQSIVNLDAGFKASARNAMEAQRARIASTLTPEQRARMSQHAAAWQNSTPARTQSNDPGTILLRMVSGGWHGMNGARWGSPGAP